MKHQEKLGEIIVTSMLSRPSVDSAFAAYSRNSWFNFSIIVWLFATKD